MKTWNIGIIGAGMVADFHAKSIQSLTNTILAGVCDNGSGKAKIIADKYGCTLFPDYHAMLQSSDVDIVTIVTPSGKHMEPAIEAAENGKHVLCEKPLDISLERIDAMIAAHKKSGTCLGGIFNYRFTDAVQLLKKAVDDNRFGIITHILVEVPWWRDDKYYSNSWRGSWEVDGGGALMNQSIHMIDMLQYLAGPIDALQAYTATLGHKIEAEDTATAILTLKNKALATIYGSTASFPGQSRKITITGTKGTAVMEDNTIKVWQFADKRDGDEVVVQASGGASASGASDPSSIPFELHARNLEAFIKAIDEGRDFEIDGTEARKAVEIVLAIYQAAKENKAFLLGE